MNDLPPTTSVKSDIWLEEKLDDYVGLRYRVNRVLFSGRSEFQSVDVVETVGHGKMLFNDGLAMISERDEFVYHEMIAHVPLFVHPHAKNVLVIGGGDGGTAREVLRHNNVEKCVMVEIDQMVIEACRQHIPVTSCVFDHPKLDLKVEDGVEFVKNTKEKFDVVIVDSTDPIGPAQPLFSEAFYGDVNSILSEDGVVVSQAESPYYNKEEQTSLYGILKSQFNNVQFYNFSNLTYPGGLWSFSFASKQLDPLKNFDEERLQSSSMEFKYYNSGIHRAAFSLPTFQRSRFS